jgi:hypothetical protein
LSVYALDRFGHWTGAGAWNLGIDRTPPTVTPAVEPMYGDAPFRDFWVSWWDGNDNLSGIADCDIQYRDGLEGVWTDLTLNTTEFYTRFVGIDGHTYTFRARARDNAGNLGVYSSDDVSRTVEICDVPADSYEADDVYGDASWISTDGVPQSHNIHDDGDGDWVKFEAIGGITYTLSTTNTGGHADTVLGVYDTDGATLLDSNNDCPGEWMFSCLDWQAPSDGVYYAKVHHWDPWAYGCTTQYSLSVVRGAGIRPEGPNVYLPLVTRDD